MTDSGATLSLKEQKEAFVTGHEGTTPWEVLLVCLAAPIGVACYQHIIILLRIWKGPNYVSKPPFITLEAVLVWFPLVLCQSNFLYPHGVVLLTMQSIIIAALRLGIIRPDREKEQSTNSDNAGNNQNNVGTASTPATTTPVKKLDFLTAYRSSILYLTFVAILAVDFHVFPRRFAKTEIYGYGLMDVGAASFCLSGGLVSRSAKQHNRHRQSPPSSSSTLAPSGLNWKQILHTLPLVVIGMLRTLANKELEYQEHVTEYGVHWNFFFTMGVMALVPPLIPSRLRGSWIVPAAIMIVYQLLLSLGQWQDYIENAPRTCQEGDTSSGSAIRCIGFLAANREGILGCFGYLSLYFIGEYIGRDFLWKRKSLWAPTLGLSILFLASSLVIPPSRRSTNLTFCLWASAHNVLLLALQEMLMVVQKIGPSSTLPIVIETVNRVGMPIFLIANLLTGLVNLTVPTLDVADVPALFIVFGYICVVGAASMLVEWAIQTLVLSKENKSAKKRD